MTLTAKDLPGSEEAQGQEKHTRKHRQDHRLELITTDEETMRQRTHVA